MLKYAATALAMLVAIPAQAQNALPVDCLANASDRSLASDLADDFLADSGLAVRPANVDNRLFAAADQCVSDYPVEPEMVEAFFSVNLAYAVSAELRRRIVATGYDMAPVEELLRLMQADPNLDVAQYIDSRPELFERPMNAAMNRAGQSEEMGIQLVGGYIGMRQQLDQNLPLLQGR